MGSMEKNKMRYAKSILDSIPDYSLTVFDKGFLGADILVNLQQGGVQRHWLIPAKSNTYWERLPAKDIAQHYTERWRIETSYRELKRAMLVTN